MIGTGETRLKQLFRVEFNNGEYVQYIVAESASKATASFFGDGERREVTKLELIADEAKNKNVPFLLIRRDYCLQYLTREVKNG